MKRTQTLDQCSMKEVCIPVLRMEPPYLGIPRNLHSWMFHERNLYSRMFHERNLYSKMVHEGNLYSRMFHERNLCSGCSTTGTCIPGCSTKSTCISGCLVGLCNPSPILRAPILTQLLSTIKASSFYLFLEDYVSLCLCFILLSACRYTNLLRVYVEPIF